MYQPSTGRAKDRGNQPLASKLRSLLSALMPLFTALAIAFAVYMGIAAVVVVWAFKVPLKQWPTYVFSEPFTLKVGADIQSVNFRERLKRLGYQQTEDPVVETGKWNESVLGLRVSLRPYLPTCRTVVTGPVSITLDMNIVRSIRLLKSDQEVDFMSIEPELLTLFNGQAQGSDICRPIPLDRINPMLIDAILLTEDTRFYSHWGIDISAIARATQANLKQWRYAQGGSTITQQLVRMTLLNPKKTILRKLNEMALAVAVNAIYSKKRVLEAYLNRVYLGQWGQFQVKGVAEASRLFFGKDTRQLEPAECAFLAATIMAPNVINPHRNTSRARSRRNVILGLMLKAGKISREDYDLAMDRPVVMNRPGAPPAKAPAYIELVQEKLARDFPALGNKAEHLDVLTSLDPVLQNSAVEVVNRFGKHGSCLIAADQNGRITAYALGGPSTWDPNSIGPEVFAPLHLIPALSPEKNQPPRWTLTSAMFVPEGAQASVTFREAFRKHTSALIEKIDSALGPERLLSVLSEFDVRAGRAKNGKIEYETMRPLEVAQVYTYLASPGKRLRLGPDLTVSGMATGTAGSPASVEILPRNGTNGSPGGTAGSPGIGAVPVNPGVIFLVNHALMGYEAPSSLAVDGPGKEHDLPSLFTTRDAGGLWAIAYDRQGLVALRVGGDELKEAAGAKIVTQLLLASAAWQSPAEGNSNQPPSGVVFRRTCLESGMRATSLCPRVIRLPFLQGTQPTEWCQIRHQSPK